MTVNNQTTQFFYDGDGNLVRKTNPNETRTIYVPGGVYEVDKTSAGAVTRTVTYYPAASAMRIDSTLYYILTDHLGSASVVTGASGDGEQRYHPYGETRFTSGTIYTDKLFTGQREITGLGLYHYGARFYSPKLGRFISPDTIVPNPENPQDLNRFSYVRNNPLRYTDPTGHMICGDGPCKPSTSGGVSGGTPTGGGGNHDDDDNDKPITDPNCANNPNCADVTQGDIGLFQIYYFGQQVLDWIATGVSGGAAVVGAGACIGGSVIGCGAAVFFGALTVEFTAEAVQAGSISSYLYSVEGTLSGYATTELSLGPSNVINGGIELQSQTLSYGVDIQTPGNLIILSTWISSFDN